MLSKRLRSRISIRWERERKREKERDSIVSSISHEGFSYSRALCLDFSNLEARLNFYQLILKFSSNLVETFLNENFSKV